MNNMTNQLDYIFSPNAIRDRCEDIYKYAKSGGTHFHVHENKLKNCAQFVHEVIKENYSKLEIPFHSRWRHFNAGQKENPNVHRLEDFHNSIKTLSPIDKIKKKWSLAIPSVLLDAGAGMSWQYVDNKNKMNFSKSEGLALATLEMYYDGFFENADALLSINEKVIEKYFQVSPSNPLVGIEGRVTLMKNLGELLKKQSVIYKSEKLGDLLDMVPRQSNGSISAVSILKVLLEQLNPIWPSRIVMNKVNLGDVWLYQPLAKDFLVPFHKLSQWMTYSLLEPLMESEISVSDVDRLTGLSEYRNGGLFLDSGVLELKDHKMAEKQHDPGSELVIEWRALTICLLDKITHLLQEKLKKTPKEFPLAKVLEGGTWWAGRKIAQSKRPDGAPPIQIKSDGTVF